MGLPIAFGKSREPLSLTKQELAAKVRELGKRQHPELEISVLEVLNEGRVEWLVVSVEHSPSNSYARRWLKQREPMELTRGVAFKTLVLACQLVSAMVEVQS